MLRDDRLDQWTEFLGGLRPLDGTDQRFETTNVELVVVDQRAGMFGRDVLVLLDAFDRLTQRFDPLLDGLQRPLLDAVEVVVPFPIPNLVGCRCQVRRSRAIVGGLIGLGQSRARGQHGAEQHDGDDGLLHGVLLSW